MTNVKLLVEVGQLFAGVLQKESVAAFAHW